MKKLKQLFLEDSKGNLSHTKLWSNIGYLILCGVFVYNAGHKIEISAEMFLLFSMVVIGNRTANKIIEFKNGIKTDDSQPK